MDENGHALFYKNRSWSSPDSIDPKGGGLLSVSCASASFCVAVDYSGNVLAYHGSSWSSPDSIDVHGNWLVSVSCPTASFCAAVDDSGDVLDLPRQLVVVARQHRRGEPPCGPSPARRRASAPRWTATATSSPTTATRGRRPTSIDPAATNWSPSRARRRASAPRWTTYGHALTYNGSSWSSPDEIDPSGGDLRSVSCPTVSFCAAVDYDGHVLTYNGTSWSSPDEIDPERGFAVSQSRARRRASAPRWTATGNAIAYNGS